QGGPWCPFRTWPSRRRRSIASSPGTRTWPIGPWTLARERSPIGPGCGAVQVAPGSHNRGLQAAVDLHSGIRQDGAPFHRDEEPACPELAPGDVLIFDALLAHCSLENTSG